MRQTADNAKYCGIFTFDNLPEQLAFDHALVLSDYQCYRTTGKVTSLR